jgi:hypothetical protein
MRKCQETVLKAQAHQVVISNPIEVQAKITGCFCWHAIIYLNNAGNSGKEGIKLRSMNWIL